MPDDQQAGNSWRETVRDIYDELHSSRYMVTGNPLAKRIITLIEERHHSYFSEPYVRFTDGGAHKKPFPEMT